MAIEFLTQTQEQFSRYASLKLQEQATAEAGEIATIGNVAPASDFENYTDQLNAYIERLGTITPLIARKWYEIAKQKPYTNEAITIEYQGLEGNDRITKDGKPRNLPYITATLTIDKQKMDSIIETMKTINGLQYNVLNILPLQWAKLGEFSYLMYHKQGITGDAMDETKIGKIFGAIPADNPADYTGTIVGVNVYTYDGYKIGEKQDDFNEIERTDNTLKFSFKFPILGLWTSETPIDRLWENAGAYGYGESLTVMNIITERIGLIFTLSDTTTVKPSPLYFTNNVRAKMETMIDYQENIEYGLNYPDDTENGGQLYTVPIKTETQQVNEIQWAKQNLKYNITKKGTDANILTFNLPCFATQYRGETGLYVSYTISSIGEASSGYFRQNNTENIWTWYEGSAGYFNNTAVINKNIPNTTEIAGDDITEMICDTKKDNGRCISNFDPVLDFKYQNKFYYTADNYITYGVGSVQVPLKAIKGNIVNNLLGITVGFGSTWRR